MPKQKARLWTCLFSMFLFASLGTGPLLAATVVFTDLPTFEANTTPNLVATFDDVSVGTRMPFTTDGVDIDTETFVSEVDDDFALIDNDRFFDGQATPPNFLITNFARVVATFPEDIQAAGFLYNCFACDFNAVGESVIEWSLLDAGGTVLESGVFDADFRVGGGGRFFGLISDTSFRSFVFERVQPSGFRNWVLDDVRGGQSTLAPPIPTLSTVALMILASLLAMGALWLLRKKARV